MCTVSYIPKENGGFYLTHNRDESIRRRIAVPPIYKNINGIEALTPIDREGGGTWIAAYDDGRVLCLLNGTKKAHTPNPPYKHSRGLVIFDYVKYSDIHDFANRYELNNLEPFTLLVYENNSLYEFRRDETKYSIKELNRALPYLYLSATLYSEGLQIERKKQLHEFTRSEIKVNTNRIVDFHKNIVAETTVHAKYQDPQLIKTVSITHIDFTGDKAEMIYHDRMNDIRLNKIIKVKQLSVEKSVA
ncbi:MAG: NRDE family protein [Desulfobacula sp.]|nr:NRDE family protein [Desulfobacula sp.]